MAQVRKKSIEQSAGMETDSVKELSHSAMFLLFFFP